MFIVESYPLAVLFCVITMLCWGSWANTQKLVHGKWRFELFYWDYVLGILLFSLVAAFTMGSNGTQGRGFIADLQQALPANLLSAFIGGVIFNLANILLTAAIAIAGMSVAFPVGIGIALILGVIVNYVALEKGNPTLLALGITLVTIAIILNARAYRVSASGTKTAGLKGIAISVVAGILMSLFYRFVAASMDLDNFVSPAPGRMTPYTASVVFAVGVVISNIVFNTAIMRRPVEGPPVTYKDYFKGRGSFHLTGILGGSIWALGNLFNLIAAGKAGPAVSYGLGQGATLVAAIWGVAIWREFKQSPRNVTGLLTGMFICFVAGLAAIIIAGGK
ncbi:multidrug DMT transporter permease [Mucilaginibacter limnophilus]|uniref:Multidrug DMT transporter permease n=1 Tax=Mucilaginibacter limnophilus TaxID=1932778 RepID=A0A3S2Y438_9SPHI|nr:GRP family sugar transporter [Mucilaginibacter limnophilus]RVU03044.1 multidrug DMT transporter permease [Mucilaginibacter limnophilus]